MAITINKGKFAFDRSVSTVSVNTSSDNRDDWIIVIRFQDTLYDGDTRITSPEVTKTITARYGEIKDRPLPMGGVVSDLFEPIYALCYEFLNDQTAADVEAARRSSMTVEQRIAENINLGLLSPSADHKI